MKRIVWTGADGVEWPLVGEQCRGVFVEHATVGAFTSKVSTPTVAVVGSTARAVSGGLSVEPISFDMTLVFAEETRWGAHGDVQTTFHEFMRGCSPLSRGVLRIDDDERGSAVLRCVVSTPPMVDYPNIRVGSFRATVGLTAHEGLWELPRSAAGDKSGKVTVANFGVVDVYPTIVWSGAGGQIVLPSRVPFSLPKVDGVRWFSLDPATSLAVTDRDGVLDRAAWLAVRDIFVEGVPPGKTAEYTVFDGAHVEWAVKVVHPWQ